MAVQEKEKMYIELRQILARQPGPELTEQLSEYKRSIKQKEWLSFVTHAYFHVNISTYP